MISIKFNNRIHQADKEENDYSTYYHLYRDQKKIYETIRLSKPGNKMHYITPSVCVELINENLEEL